MSAPRAISFLLLLAAFLLVGLVHGECEAPPQNHPAMITMLECMKEFGQDRLCTGDCMFVRLGVVSEGGDVQVERAEELLASLPDGDLKEAFWEVWRKCAKGGKGLKVNRSLPNCAGLAKMAKCFRKVVTERCPGLAKMLDM